MKTADTTVLAVDVGGTKLAVGIVGADGRDPRPPDRADAARPSTPTRLFATLAAAIDDLGATR